MATSNYRNRYETFRTLLVMARKAAGLTQHQVARAVSKPQSYVSKYERGERRLDFVEFIELAEILRIDLALFLNAFRPGNTGCE